MSWKNYSVVTVPHPLFAISVAAAGGRGRGVPHPRRRRVGRTRPLPAESAGMPAAGRRRPSRRRRPAGCVADRRAVRRAAAAVGRGRCTPAAAPTTARGEPRRPAASHGRRDSHDGNGAAGGGATPTARRGATDGGATRGGLLLPCTARRRRALVCRPAAAARGRRVRPCRGTRRWWPPPAHAHGERPGEAPVWNNNPEGKAAAPVVAPPPPPAAVGRRRCPHLTRRYAPHRLAHPPPLPPPPFPTDRTHTIRAIGWAVAATATIGAGSRSSYALIFPPVGSYQPTSVHAGVWLYPPHGVTHPLRNGWQRQGLWRPAWHRPTDGPRRKRFVGGGVRGRRGRRPARDGCAWCACCVGAREARAWTWPTEVRKVYRRRRRLRATL